MKFKNGLPIQVRFNDIDVQGHVNNSVYFNFFDLGRLDYFRDILGHDLENKELGVTIASTKTDYFKEVGLYDQVEVVTKITRLGTKSFDLLQQLRHRQTGEVHCESLTVMVCFNFIERKSIELPSEWRVAIKSYEGL